MRRGECGRDGWYAACCSIIMIYVSTVVSAGLASIRYVSRAVAACVITMRVVSTAEPHVPFALQLMGSVRDAVTHVEDIPRELMGHW